MLAALEGEKGVDGPDGLGIPAPDDYPAAPGKRLEPVGDTGATRMHHRRPGNFGSVHEPGDIEFSCGEFSGDRAQMFPDDGDAG